MTDIDSNAKEIFFEALDRAAPEQLIAYVEEACGEDVKLRRRVDDLLRAHQDAGKFLGGSVSAVATIDQLITEKPGETIGPYKLLQQIGEGGMGVVFMAEQTEPIQRTVALKIIKPGMDTRQVIARFEAERQAVAMMDHPNIAKVLDAGTTDSGRPYFVMELVKGVPITKYCDEKLLPLRARLELFMQVCQAVQHAHQKGIIHRDIKPNNVLVAEYDNRAVPKVIDFGVAKATAQRLTERTMFTEFGQVLGTMEYMSPEQSKFNQLDIDTRSDIYSLGVLLYELLAGSTPFEGKRLHEAAFDEMLRIIREEEPPKPSTRLSSIDTLPSVAANRHTEPARLSKDVRGDLDWIVMKALEKDRNRRYETASGFAADIERHLHDEPVKAGPPSVTYRFRKFARRNKSVLVAAALIAVALVLGTVISTWQALRARKAEALAQTRLVTEEQARASAVAEAAKAKAISDLLQEMLETASPNPKAGADYTVRQLLDDFSTRLGDQLKNQPEAELAVRSTIGNTYRQLALPKQAEPHLKAAMELRRRLYGPDSRYFADGLIVYAWNLRQAGDRAGAERYAREALAIFQKENTDPKRILSAFSGLQHFLIGQSKYVEAEAVGQEALAFARQQGLEAQLGGILQSLSTIKRVTGSPAEAEKLSREALALQRSIPGGALTYPLLEHATNLTVQGKHAEAEPLLREALDVLRHRHFDESHPTMVDVKLRLAGVLGEKGDKAGMKALFTPLLIDLDKDIAVTPDNLFTRMRRAIILRDLGRLDDAIKEYIEILARKPDHPGTRRKLIDCYNRKGDHAKTVADLSEAIKLAPQESVYWEGRGTAYLMLGELDKAAEDFVKLRELKPNVEMDIAHHYHDAGYVLHGKRQLKEAESAYRQALLLKQQAVAAFPDNASYRFHLTFTYGGLVAFLRETNRLEEAAKLRDEAVPVFEKVAADSPNSVEQQLALPRFLRDAGDLDRALAQFSKILDQHPNRWDAWSDRASTHFRRQHWEQAIADFTKAIELAPQVHTNWLHRGHSYLALAQWDKAAADFTKVIEGWPNDAGGWYLRSLAYAQLSQPDKALADLREAIAKGYKDVEQMKTDSKLDPLRSNEEFKKLLTELEREKK